MYYENPDFATKNRASESVLQTSYARLADGGDGVVVTFSGFPLVLTNDGAMRLATGIAEVLQRTKDRKK